VLSDFGRESRAVNAKNIYPQIRSSRQQKKTRQKASAKKLRRKPASGQPNRIREEEIRKIRRRNRISSLSPFSNSADSKETRTMQLHRATYARSPHASVLTGLTKKKKEMYFNCFNTVFWDQLPTIDPWRSRCGFMFPGNSTYI